EAANSTVTIRMSFFRSARAPVDSYLHRPKSGGLMSDRSAVLIAAVLAACATPGKNTAIGAGGGAAAGAVVGGGVGGWKGAAIGAGVGALAGGSVGNYLDKQAQELQEVAETKRTRDGILVKLSSELLFQTGSAILKEDAIAQLERLGDVLAKY